jgi:CheY-like chemotaxis protein
MNFLIAEDDENKREMLRIFLRESFPKSNISEAHSYHSSMEAIINNSFDLILLDMSMPTSEVSIENFDNEHDTFAGREILDQMSLREIDTKVILVTQFDIFDVGRKNTTLEELKNDLTLNFSSIFKGVVYYRSNSDIWKNELTLLVKSTLGE